MAYIGSQPTKVVSQQSSRVYRYTATAGQTAFSGADVDNQVLNVTPSDVEVHMNGLLLDPTDYTATSSSVTLGTAANAGDELTVTGMVTFEVADTYNKATADARYVDVAGDTMTGALALPSGGFTVGTDQLAVDSSGRVTMADQPAFFVYCNNDQSIGNTSGVQVDYNTKVYDTGNNFNTSTNTYTAPIGGVYHFDVTVTYRYPFTSPRIIAYVLVNGSNFAARQTYRAGTDTGVNVSCSLHLDANDAVTVHTYQDSGASRVLLGADAWTHFSGHLIG